ncbi:F-box protein At5g49610-like [Nymphaea colorata]|nr:F-box protein At5g49610-like [Nymphaea colorata]
MAQRNLPELPYEIISAHILPRLPVKSLMRFKSVCKSWLRRIEDKAFVHAHYSMSKQKPLLLYDAFASPHLPPKLYSLLDKHNPSFKTIPSQLFPLRSFRIQSICRGLICLEGSYPPHQIQLINIATGRFLPLPHSSTACLCNSVYHLLYDPSLSAFKLLHMFHDQGEIFTVGRDRSWRKIPDTAEGLVFVRSGDLRQPNVNGVFHWINKCYDCSYDYHEESITAFNVVDETVNEMASPKTCPDQDKTCWKLHKACLDEVGGFLNYLHLGRCCDSLDVWVLKDYAGQVWIKEYSVAVSFIPRKLRKGQFKMVRTGAAGEEVLIVAANRGVSLMASFNLLSQTFHEFRGEGFALEATFHMFMYEGSLYGN